jgi:hypothetical protein
LPRRILSMLPKKKKIDVPILFFKSQRTGLEEMQHVWRCFSPASGWCRLSGFPTPLQGETAKTGKRGR